MLPSKLKFRKALQSEHAVGHTFDSIATGLIYKAINSDQFFAH